MEHYGTSWHNMANWPFIQNFDSAFLRCSLNIYWANHGTIWHLKVKGPMPTLYVSWRQVPTNIDFQSQVAVWWIKFWIKKNRKTCYQISYWHFHPGIHGMDNFLILYIVDCHDISMVVSVWWRWWWWQLRRCRHCRWGLGDDGGV